MAEPAEREPQAQDLQNIETPEQLPLLPVRDIVVFPYMVLPLFVGREMSIKAIEAALALWDYAALAVILQEAGGRVTTLDGEPLRPGGSVLSSNGAIHEELVRRFNEE